MLISSIFLPRFNFLAQTVRCHNNCQTFEFFFLQFLKYLNSLILILILILKSLLRLTLLYKSLPYFVFIFPLCLDTSESPVLRAYPDWETNSIPDENDKASHSRRIASVFRIFVDNKCDRLWFVDVGRRNDSWQIIQPKIVVINLQTDKIIR